MKKIIVTGGAGYIGSHMTMLLLQSGYEPIVIDNLSNSSEYNLQKVKEFTGKDFKFYNLNILKDLSPVDTSDVYGIIHFAALKAIGDSVLNPIEYYKNNVAGTINLVQFAVKNNIKNFIFSSTAAIYDSSQEPVSEDFLKRPTSPYARTKFFCEQILQDASNADLISSVALRYFNVAGNQEDGIIGEAAKDPKNLIPSIIMSYLGYRKTNLMIYGNNYPTRDGTTIRDFIHVLDLCNAHLKALEYLEINSGHFAFNLGTKNGSTIKEILDTFEKVTGDKLDYQIVERRPGDVITSIANPNKANLELKWKAERTIEDMISSSLKWYKKGFKEANNL